MEVLLKTKSYERELFFNAAIAADDLITLNDFNKLNLSLSRNFVLIGRKIRCKIFSYLLNKYYKNIENVKSIYNEEKISNLSIEGAITIVKKAGYIKEGE